MRADKDERVLTAHPDLALLENEARRDIFCLVVEGAQAEKMQALAGLGAFCAYRQGTAAALLFDRESGVQAEALEEALRGMGLQRAGQEPRDNGRDAQFAEDSEGDLFPFRIDA